MLADNEPPAHLYGCHNKPRPTAKTTIPAQDGWDYDQAGPGGVMTRTPRIVEIPHTMSTACVIEPHDGDRGCTGCQSLADRPSQHGIYEAGIL